MKLIVMTTVCFFISSVAAIEMPTSKSTFASPIMVNYLSSGGMHIITSTNLQFYELTSDEVHLKSNYVSIKKKSQSLYSKWPILKSSSGLLKDFTNGSIVCGIEDGGSQKVFFFSYRTYCVDVSASTVKTFVENDIGKIGIYFTNSNQATIYQLYNEARLTYICKVVYDTELSLFIPKKTSTVCTGLDGVVHLLLNAEDSSCSQSPEALGNSSSLTTGFAVTIDKKERFYLFGEKLVVTFADGSKLETMPLEEFFNLGSSPPPHQEPSSTTVEDGDGSTLIPNELLIGSLIAIGVVLVFLLVVWLWCWCNKSSSPSSSHSKHNRAKHLQQKKDDEEAEMAAALMSAAVTAGDDFAIEDAHHWKKPKKPPAFLTGKVGLRSKSKRKPKSKLRRKTVGHASDVLPKSLANTIISSLRTNTSKVEQAQISTTTRSKGTCSKSVAARKKKKGKNKVRNRPVQQKTKQKTQVMTNMLLTSFQPDVSKENGGQASSFAVPSPSAQLLSTKRSKSKASSRM